MTKRFLTLLIAGSVLVFSCKKEKEKEDNTDNNTPAPTTGTLKLNVVTKYGSQNFAMNTDFYNPLNQRIQFEMLQFFVTNLYVTTSSGDSVLFKDAFKYDYTNASNSIEGTLAPGSYTGMRLSFGVDSARNHSDPTAYDPAHPLSYNLANTMHWGWASGYIFMKFEGKSDNSGTGTGPLSQFLAYHPGNDACYETGPFMPKSFTITAGSTLNLNLVLDVEKFITTSTDTFDLTVDNLTHFTDNPGLAKRISKNVAAAFYFE